MIAFAFQLQQLGFTKLPVLVAIVSCAEEVTNFMYRLTFLSCACNKKTYPYNNDTIRKDWVTPTQDKCLK